MIAIPPTVPLPQRSRSELERLYRTLWETTTDAVLILDVDSNITSASPATRHVLGHDPAELVGRNLAVVQPERYRAAHRVGLQRYVDSGVRTLDWRSTEAVALRADGSEVPVEIAFADIDLDGERMFVGFFRDITDRKRTEAALFDEKERAQTTLRSIADGVVTTDVRGVVTFINAAAEALCGWSADAAVGRSCSEVLRLGEVPEQDVPDLVAVAMDSGTTLQLGGGALLIRRDGEPFCIEGSIAPITDRHGELAGAVIAFRDVSLSRRMAAEIRHQASHDALTGLVNRAEFDRRLCAALDKATLAGTHHSLLYLDLDQFKVVNDTCGHTAGDELLRQVATILRASLRENDTLARLGGDEFGVLLEGCTPEPAQRIADTLRRSLGDFTFAWQEKLFSVGASIGQVNFDDGSMTPIEILSTADAACYVAKDQGRNRIHTYQPQDRALALRQGEMEWIGRINKAMDDGTLCLFAQPIRALDSDELLHHEVLLRMRDAHGGLILPMAFIPAAERYNLMPAVDRWVIRQVLERLAAQKDPRGPGVAINLSGASMSDTGLATFVRGMFASTRVDPAAICFEVTETAAIANLSSAAVLLGELKAMGCTVALDDFGSGMSSFAYLKHLPIDFLKIDGGFVRDLLEDPIDQAMVESINHIGHVMGLRTIAEFAESLPIIERLREIGVDYAQGYGVGRPAPFE
ncbi:MAG: EAL domain-containing protein [Pseudomonadota bacterium]|nr:EAL domain-containing protein [Pseudomonadota bacterium]